MESNVYIHPTAEVSKKAIIGDGTKIWHQAQVREGAQVGQNCVLGKGVYVDVNVSIGDRVKVQNGVSMFQGVTVEEDVIIAANAAFTNDKYPRAFIDDWEVTPTLIKQGASIGANATIICGVTIGCYAMVGSGSVVTKDVPDYGLVYGNPARLEGSVDKQGRRVIGS